MRLCLSERAERIATAARFIPCWYEIEQEDFMRSILAYAAMAAALALAGTAPAYAQGAPQTVQLAKVDVMKTATGYRASKVIGGAVVNDANETVGKVDDIIIGTDKMP